MKTILYVVSHYYPYIGGVEYVVKSVAERLVKNWGYNVIVLAGSPGTHYPLSESINNVKVVRWPTISPRDAYHMPRRFREFKESLKEMLSNVDIIHVHSAHSILSVMSGLITKELYGDMKLVVSPHYHGGGHGLLRNILWKVLWKKYVDKLLSKADKVHAVSHVEAQLIAKHFRNVGEKLVVIPNGVEEDVLNYKWAGEDSDYIIYAGRVEKYKRLVEAIKAVNVLSRELRVKLKLIIVGEGPYLDTLKRIALNYGNVEFLKPLPRHKYLHLLSKARYAINLSIREAFSLFTAEALTIGTPVIVSRHIASIFSKLTTVELSIDPILSRRVSDDIVIMKKTANTRIGTWSDIVKEYISSLYT